ncbi:MAG TPA: hypothetical protein VGM91_24430 [Conexibacter sp.]
MDEFAAGKHRLQALADAGVEDGRNEATTRIHLIDPLLIDCLGWLPEDIRTEVRVERQRTDYEVGRPTPRIVVEAKREGIGFELPVGVTSRIVEIQTLLQTGAVREALVQVRDYCQDRSIPIAVATNGHQLIAFLASRQDGVRALEGKALVFRSLEDMLVDFRTLWECLSPSGLAEATLQRRLGETSRLPLPPAKLATRAASYPGFRTRSEEETDLKILGQLFVLDIATEGEVSDDFLRECYCPSGALSQYALVSKEILRARYALVERVLPNVEPVQRKRGVSPKLGPDVLAAALSKRPVLILGDVGVGKTMFLRHLLRVDSKDVLREAITLYLDFGSEPAVASELASYVATRLIDQLREDYTIDIFDGAFVRAVYNAEINRFGRGIAAPLKKSDPAAFEARELQMLEDLLADRGRHVGRSLDHIRGTSGRTVVVVLDNVDQRPKSFQEEVFLIGGAIASGWPATVFIALRPRTFYDSSVHGSLNAYHSRAFSVSPARTDEVILRRLKFARKQLVETGRLDSFPQGLSINSSNLTAYVDVLIQAFERNEALKEMLDNLSGGNLRMALDFLNTFVGSGYVRTRRILDIASTGGTYTVPLHEFFRAITFGDAELYDPTRSPIANIFDLSRDDPREHFLMPSLVLESHRLGEGGQRSGYVAAGDIFAYGTSCGFSQEQVGAQLSRALRGRLLEGSDEADLVGFYRTTSVGLYTVRKLAGMFTYVDAVVVDTPIVEVQARVDIALVSSIYPRIERARRFRQYLDQQWELVGSAPLAFNWPATSALLGAGIDAVASGAARNEARRSLF